MSNNILFPTSSESLNYESPNNHSLEDLLNMKNKYGSELISPDDAAYLMENNVIKDNGNNCSLAYDLLNIVNCNNKNIFSCEDLVKFNENIFPNDYFEKLQKLALLKDIDGNSYFKGEDLVVYDKQKIDLLNSFNELESIFFTLENFRILNFNTKTSLNNSFIADVKEKYVKNNDKESQVIKCSRQQIFVGDIKDNEKYDFNFLKEELRLQYSIQKRYKHKYFRQPLCKIERPKEIFISYPYRYDYSTSDEYSDFSEDNFHKPKDVLLKVIEGLEYMNQFVQSHNNLVPNNFLIGKNDICMTDHGSWFGLENYRQDNKTPKQNDLFALRTHLYEWSMKGSFFESDAPKIYSKMDEKLQELVDYLEFGEGTQEYNKIRELIIKSEIKKVY